MFPQYRGNVFCNMKFTDGRLPPSHHVNTLGVGKQHESTTTLFPAMINARYRDELLRIMPSVTLPKAHD